MLRGTGCAVAAGLAAAALFAAGPSPAALTEGGPARNTAPRPVMLAQAPARAPDVETNIAQLHQRLGITPAQEPQFQALANVMRENARTMPAAPPAPNLNAVEALRFTIQFAQTDLNGMRRMLPALQALYASLSPAQRLTADQVFRQGPGE
jgi:periplasmic protein CpxP/Spy